MCIMNDVDPLAASRSWVLRVSKSVATNTNVTSGHQPGNGRRTAQTAAPDNAAAAATIATKIEIRAVRGIRNKVGDPVKTWAYDQVAPSLLPNKPATMLVRVTSRLIFNMSVPLE